MLCLKQAQMVARGGGGGGAVDDGAPPARPPAVVYPITPPALALAPRTLHVEPLRAGVPGVDGVFSLFRIALGDEDGQRLAGPGVRMDVVAEASDVVVLGTPRLVGHGEEGDCVGEGLAPEGHPLVRLPPSPLALVELLAGAVEGARDDAV